MSIKKKSVQDIQLNGIKTLLYGQSGTGKTVSCGTMPGKVALISCEAGDLSLRNCPTPMDIFELHTMDDLKDVYAYLTGDGYNEYTSICLDSVSEIAEVVLADAKQATNPQTGKLLYPDGRQAYYAMQEDMSGIIKAFRNIPNKHVLFTAKLEKSMDANTNMMMYGPMLPGQKLSNLIAYDFDLVFRECIGQDSDGQPFRYFQTQPDRFSIAKDRSGILNPIEKPDMTYIINKVLGIKEDENA